MAIESFYFSHDYNARSDRKLMALQMSMGLEGIGIYWCIVEMLYEEGGELMLSECERIAFELRTDKDSITQVVKSDLFNNDGTKFWSESILRRLDKRHEKSKKASDSAKKRWKDANAMRTHSEGNAIKERKGKENKEKDIIYDLTSNPLGLYILIKDSTKSTLRIHQQSFDKYLEGTFGMAYEGQKMALRNKRPPIEEFFKKNNGNTYNDNQHVWSAFKKLWIEGGNSFNPNPGKIQ